MTEKRSEVRSERSRPWPAAIYSWWLAAWVLAFALGLVAAPPFLSLWIAAALSALLLAVASPRDPFVTVLVVWLHVAPALAIPAVAETAGSLLAQACVFAAYLAYLRSMRTDMGRVYRLAAGFLSEASALEVLDTPVSRRLFGHDVGAPRVRYSYG